MQNRSPDNDNSRKGLIGRLDRIAAEMNVFLIVLAIGLATLDLTCLWAFKMRDALPTIGHLATTSHPGAATRPNQASDHLAAAVTPTHPGTW